MHNSKLVGGGQGQLQIFNSQRAISFANMPAPESIGSPATIHFTTKTGGGKIKVDSCEL